MCRCVWADSFDNNMGIYIKQHVWIVEAAGEATEIIYSLLPGNDQLLLSICQNPPTCTRRVAIALTRRRYICPGERELFLSKFRELKIPVSLDNQLEPTTNGKLYYTIIIIFASINHKTHLNIFYIVDKYYVFVFKLT